MAGASALGKRTPAQRPDDTRYAPVALGRQNFVPVGGRARPQHATAGNLSDGTLQGTTFRVIVPVLATSYGLRFRYSNFYNNGGVETDGPNDIIVAAAVELGGVIYRITFGGQTSVTIKPGAYVDSDAMGFDVAKGSTLPVRTYVSVGTLGQKWPLGFTAVTANSEGSNRANTDLTPTGSGGVAVVADKMYGPSAVFGHIAAPTALVGICGDSIAAGFTTTAEQGFVEKALTGVYPFQSVAFPSDNASQWGSHVARRRRIPFLDGSTHIIAEQGANSLTGGLATLQAQQLALWTLFATRGALVYQTTVTPRTTSTDAWLSTVNQTVTANEATRIGFNDWLRAGAPINSSTKAAVAVGTGGALLAGQAGHPLTGYFEVADLVETARNSGIWKPAQRTVTDMAATAASATITSATAAFTAADVGSSVAIVGAGASGATLSSTIATVTNGTTATLIATALPSTTVSGASAGIGTYTADGLHPTQIGHNTLAASITPSATFKLAAVG